MIIIIPLLAFILTTAIIMSIYASFQQKRISERLEKLTSEKKNREARNLSALVKEIVSPVARSSLPGIKKYRDKIESQIVLAGRPFGIDFNIFVGAQILTAVVSVLFIYITFEIANPGTAVISAAAGVILPVLWLRSKVAQRHKSIFRSLPDVLDSITLSMEAGLDFISALKKYLEKSQSSVLNDELYLVQQEIGMGKTRIEALNSLEERLNHPGVNSFVTSLVQGIHLGSSLVPILRAQSEQLRIQRFQLAEKLASEMSTKMLFPLLFFIFPTIFIVLFGPIILTFLR
jgi:tight adherence protein C